ncbi:MAG: GAF domain-containing protein [Armatimonadota bacterium]|nr:GAF domain-containing protein [Armatimonadota bacterium]MDR7463744.1 GAF domain-containing protein [Armatimonadota bacterium]MDR7469267.1 GAF domain-containing protein [Armatimonadota bacterium]MDR7475113.1 GAF domain-containing protein [Armatimonadota bacterium]MDR7538980.1 GAF domain-containing protein [Armatimonadota bacterium]
MSETTLPRSEPAPERREETLLARLRRKEAELAALREISRAIGAALDLDTTLALVTRKTAEVTGMDSCSVYLLDPAGEFLVLRATTGLAQEAIGRARLRWGEGMTGWAASHAAPAVSSDAAQDPRFVYLPETRELAFRSLAAVPLQSGGRVLGAMNVQTRAVHEYSPEEIDLLSTIADLVAGAIEKAALYDSMRRQIGELSTLAEASKTLTAPLYLEEMLRLIAEMATRLMRAAACVIYLLDQESDRLVPAAAHGGDGGTERDGEALLAGLAEEAVRTGRPLALADVRERAPQALPRAALAVPLTVRGKTIGAFLAARSRVHQWTAEEVERLSTLAHQTALAIENSTLVVRSALVREMHHRVKNNLQTIAMLLRLQLRGDRPVSGREVLTETVNRILSIAAVHEILSVEGFRMVNVRHLVERVARSAVENMLPASSDITVDVAGDDLYLPSQQATSLALAVNELVQNAVEHAFPGRARGKISIRLGRHEEQCFLEVQDDGVGLQPREAEEETLGLQIVRALATEDLRGTFTLESGQGTRVLIAFPRPQTP